MPGRTYHRRVRIILHAGLHKSGTTSLQTSWNAAYSDHPEVWYPRRGDGRPPGHHDLVRPLLRAFGEDGAPDLVAARLAHTLRGRSGETLADVIAQARDRGARTLLVSTENLDRATEADRPVLQDVLGGEDVTLVVTATRPVHRWCSGWQTLVKHGLAQYPADAARHVLDFAALRPGRLAGLLDLVPATRRVLRLVRTTPPEADLAADLAAALGLPDPERAAGHPMQNTSLGTDTEVVLRINRADRALGTSKAGRRLLAELRGTGFTYREDGSLAERYALPEALVEGARAEAEWVAGLGAGGGVELLDPRGALAGWLDWSVPEWYAAISRREAVLPALEPVEDRETQLWRVRQERAAYQRRLERVQKRSEGQAGSGSEASTERR
jgi:hypothetical protein